MFIMVLCSRDTAALIDWVWICKIMFFIHSFLNSSFVESNSIKQNFNHVGNPSKYSFDVDESYEFQIIILRVHVEKKCWDTRCNIKEHGALSILQNDQVDGLDPRDIFLERCERRYNNIDCQANVENEL